MDNFGNGEKDASEWQFALSDERRSNAAEMTENMKNRRRNLSEILLKTLDVNDVVDWEKQRDRREFPEFKYIAPIPKQEDYILKKKSLFNEIPKQKKLNEQFFKENEEYIFQKKAALKRYLSDKIEQITEINHNNSDLDNLKYYFDKSEKSAIEEYATLVIENSKYPDEIDIHYNINFYKTGKTFTINCLLPSIENFPLIDSFKFDLSSGKMIELPMNAEKSSKFYEQTLISIGIRTIHELYEAFGNNGVEKIIFNGYVSKNNQKIFGEKRLDGAKDFTKNTSCIFAINAEKLEFMQLDLASNDIESLSEKLHIVRVKKFNDFTQLMAPISAK
ncbi:MAG: hypothetical protein RR540_02700 [Oscillospiraceae bacterium]